MSIDHDEDRRQVVRVAVIGIGSAGLGQLKQLIDAFEREDVRRTKRLELVGFETRDDVGGIWNHDPTPEPFVTSHIATAGGEQTYIYPRKDQNPTAVYDGLRALLPHDLMAFRDLTFPEGTVLFPPGSEVCEYLQRYAAVFDLRQHIRFSTRVERLLQDPTSRTWTIESLGTVGRRVEEFDHVAVCNGDYNDPWLPRMPGLSAFPGRVIHSREYRRATDYAGKTVLVIGSFSSGSDIARLVAGLNVSHYSPDGSPLNGHVPDLPYTKVYQSTTGTTNKANVEDPTTAWWPYIHKLPMIHHFEPASDAHPRGRIHFKSDPPAHEPVDDVDVVIFCTGYNNALPFAKADDYPWNEHRVLEQAIAPEEREGGDEWEAGGLRGLHMRGLDPMLIFLENDRSIAFIGLPYSIVPFPFSEVQARLVAYHWANLVTLPKTLSPPVNNYNKYYDPLTRTTPGLPGGPSPDGVVPDLAGENEAVAKVRFSLANRREFVFPHPYEWEYCDYVFDLLRTAEREEVPARWTRVEEWRREKRADEGLRKRTLGY